MAKASPRPGRPRRTELARTPGPLRSAHLETVLLFVHDFEGMLRFYRDTLGLTVRYSSSRFAELAAAGEMTISLHPGRSDRATKSESLILEFGVSDLDQVVDQLNKLGIHVDPIRDESFGRIASFWDPEGHRIGLEQPRRRSD